MEKQLNDGTIFEIFAGDINTTASNYTRSYWVSGVPPEEQETLLNGM
jgi:hypothetical protein